MIVKNIIWNSNDYQQMIDLRIKTLLQPIGIPASYINVKKEENDILIAAFEENEMIGCCILTLVDKEIVQLRQMAVQIDAQTKGIGSSILKFAEKKAREMGFSTLMMHARNPVVEFYKKCGYSIVGEEFFEVGIGHHKMQKILI